MMKKRALITVFVVLLVALLFLVVERTYSNEPTQLPQESPAYQVHIIEMPEEEVEEELEEEPKGELEEETEEESENEFEEEVKYESENEFEEETEGESESELEEESEDVEESAEEAFYWEGIVLTPVLGRIQGPSGVETYYNLPMEGVISIM